MNPIPIIDLFTTTVDRSPRNSIDVSPQQDCRIIVGEVPIIHPDMHGETRLRLFSRLTYYIHFFVSHFNSRCKTQKRQLQITAPVMNFDHDPFTHTAHGANT